MLRHLTVKGFKAFDAEGVSLALGRITVFIGANGTGKSSVLQSLLLLKQSAKDYGNRALRLDGPLVDVGSFEDVAHAGNAQRPVHLSLVADFCPPAPDEPAYDQIASGTYAYTIIAHRDHVEQNAEITFGHGATLSFAVNPHSPGPTPNNKTLVLEGCKLSFGPGDEMGRPIRLVQYDPTQAPNIGAITARVEAILATIISLLDRYQLVPTLRGLGSLAYDVIPGDLANGPRPAGNHDEQAMIANAVASRPDVADEVSHQLEAILGTSGRRLRSRLKRGRIAHEIGAGRRGVNVAHEAFGLNQLLVALFRLDEAPMGSLIAIEEPEIHLHPKAQAALCRVLVDVASSERKQLILTTHSEHILMGLLSAVADGRLGADDLAVYDFHLDREAARTERLAVNDHGQVEGGLREFLEVDLAELGALLESRFQRQPA